MLHNKEAVFPVHIAINLHWKHISFISSLGTRWMLVVSLTSRPLYIRGKSSRCPLNKSLGRTPEPVWTFWRREKLAIFLSTPIGFSRPDLREIWYSYYTHSEVLSFFMLGNIVSSVHTSWKFLLPSTPIHGVISRKSESLTKKKFVRWSTGTQYPTRMLVLLWVKYEYNNT